MDAKRVQGEVRHLQWLISTGTLILCMLGISGCGASTEIIKRIALLAPFEGRYRELGYNAYYAARLAMQDFAQANIELLAIDDGGTINHAVDRAKALQQDPLVKVVIALGYDATDVQVQDALGNLPMLMVGDWGNKPDQKYVFALDSQKLADVITVPGKTDVTEAARLQTPITGGEIFTLRQFPLLKPNTDGITIASSASLPDGAFRERYMNSGLFVPEPGLLATLTYDAFGVALRAMKGNDAAQNLAEMTYEGLNGRIRFEHGYWADSPVYYYCYRPTASGNTSTQKLILEPCIAPSR